MAKKTVSGIKIVGDGKYPLVPLACIEVRPRDSDVLFHNMRNSEKFTPDKLQTLCQHIRADTLLKPLTVNIATDGNGNNLKVELIAGERRFTVLSWICKSDLPCFDESTKNFVPKKGMVVLYRGDFYHVDSAKTGKVELTKYEQTINDSDIGEDTLTDEKLTIDSPEELQRLLPTVSGAKLYSSLACKVFYDSTEEHMLRLAMEENEDAEPLTTSEEVATVERLVQRGCKQDDIAYMLASNITWVSQTASFRRELPPEAFEKLINGSMARHVAVGFLGYDKDVRQKLFENSVIAEETETKEKLKSIQSEVENLEDEEELHKADARSASKKGDEKAEAAAKKKANSTAKKIEAAAKKKERVKEESGKIRQGHVRDGAAAAGILPRKAKMLQRSEIEELYVEELKALDEETSDPVTNEIIPIANIKLISAIALAILRGERDPIAVHRQFMIDQGSWKGVKTSSSKKKSPQPLADDYWNELENDPDAGYVDDDEFEEDFDSDLEAELELEAMNEDD